MNQTRTLTEMMELRARETPDRAALFFGDEEWSFAAIWHRAGQLGASLRDRGVCRGDRVVLVLPNGPEFFFGFYGLLRLGAIAVPIFPGSGPERIAARATLSGASAIVVPSDTSPDRHRALEVALGQDNSTAISLASDAADPRKPGFPRVEPDEIAMLQYTSGSTGNPKGVQLSHDNLITNMRQMIAGMKITKTDVFVSWLPVYHDMGLILKTMVPFYLPAKLVLLPTTLTNVRTWLRAIEEHRGTFTAAPDFAYRLCLRYVRNPEDYDLSSLRVALNAAEPVRSTTIRDFERAFGLENVMVAAYGLAEATVGVSMWPPGTEAMVDSRGLVSVGFPFPGIELRIATDDRTSEPGEIGTILIMSPANTRGYWENPSATSDLHRRAGFIDSGDLGYLDEAGRLFIAGREKNIIITAGRNIAPQEVEEIVDPLPGVRFSAALGIDRGRLEGEQLYLFAEIRGRPTAASHDELTCAIVVRVHQGLGLRPGRVYLLRRRSIPQTHNGKIRHQLLKARYLSGSLRADGMILSPDY